MGLATAVFMCNIVVIVVFLSEALTELFNRCLSDGRVPSSWKNASVVLIHKKGDTADIKTTDPLAFYQ